MLRVDLWITLVIMEDENSSEWRMQGKIMLISYDQVSEILEWKDLYRELINEEEGTDGFSYAEIPMLRIQDNGYMDVMIVVKLRYKWLEEG